MSFITTLIKKLLNILFKLLTTKIIVVIVANCAVILIVELSEIIKNTLKNINSKILTPLNLLENWLFEFIHDAYSAYENFLQNIKTQITNLLNSLLPEEIEIILSIINFANWIDLTITSTVQSIKNTIQTIINTTVTPALTLTSAILTSINTVEQITASIQTRVNEKTDFIYNTANNQLQTAQTVYNTQVNSTIDAIIHAFNWYNEGIDYTEASTAQQKNVIEAYNNYIESIIDLTINSNDDDAIVNLINQIQPLSTGNLNIDFNQYKILLATPPTFSTSFTVPDHGIDFTDIQNNLAILQNDINSLNTELNQLASKTQFQFNQQFIITFKAEFIEQFKIMLIAGITQIIILKTEAIINIINNLKSTLQTAKQEKQSEITTKAVETVQDLSTDLVEVVDAVPELLKPSFEKYLDMIMEKVEQAREQISDNLDMIDFLPDVQAIESIMNQLPTGKYKPSVSPLITKKTRKRKNNPLLTIQDIYRLLCDNFYRNERLALCFALAPHDLRIEVSELGNLIIGMTNS